METTPPPSPPSSQRLTVLPVPGTVLDRQTGLVWLPPAAPQALSYPAAREACTGPLAARGWRLPQIGELVDFLICLDVGDLGLSPAAATTVWSASQAPLAGEEAMRVAVWGPDGVRVGIRTPLETAMVWLVRAD